jgi:hypothetical protein|tara:strand:- start:528 stop:794 length:267 start_codon:yes stop_codon:yes gene_type:complete
MPKPNRAVDKALKRVDKREEKATQKQYSPNSRFARADQRRITANLSADSFEKLRVAAATKRKPAGKILDELIQGYVDKIKTEKPGYLK